VEIKKFSLLPGCCLDQLVSSMTQGADYDQVLENFGAVERDGWLRQCTRGPGEDGVCAGAFAMEIGGA
jgi:hypothetical protein